jgi:nitrate reductase gamma subunit
MNLLDTFFLGYFPYVAVVVFVIGMIYRYRRRSFTISSLSSQFLEGRSLFWGTVPFHIGILAVLVGHLIAFLIPQGVIAWNAVPARLLVLEGMALVFGLSCLVGLGALMARRFTNPRVRAVTTPMDVAIEVVLLGQIVLGVWIAVGYRWGSSWFASDLTPYLWSLFGLSPEIGAVAAMPLVVKLHIIGAFAILFLIPFTRLAHVFVAPFHYLVRPYQQVIWNWDRRLIRDPSRGTRRVPRH